MRELKAPVWKRRAAVSEQRTPGLAAVKNRPLPDAAPVRIACHAGEPP